MPDSFTSLSGQKHGWQFTARLQFWNSLTHPFSRPGISFRGRWIDWILRAPRSTGAEALQICRCYTQLGWKIIPVQNELSNSENEPKNTRKVINVSGSLCGQFYPAAELLDTISLRSLTLRSSYTSFLLHFVPITLRSYYTSFLVHFVPITLRSLYTSFLFW